MGRTLKLTGLALGLLTATAALSGCFDEPELDRAMQELKDESEQLLAIISSVEDADDIPHAETQMALQQDRLRALVDRVKDKRARQSKLDEAGAEFKQWADTNFAPRLKAELERVQNKPQLARKFAPKLEAHIKTWEQIFASAKSSA